MQGATISYFSANSDKGRFLIPVFELTGSSTSITFEAGDRIAFSILAYATSNSQYSSVIGDISNNPQEAIKIKGVDGEYPLYIKIASVSDGAGVNRIIQNWEAPDGTQSVWTDTKFEWYSPIYGSQKYFANPICLYKYNNNYYMCTFQLWESFTGSAGMFSVNPPSDGVLGDVVVDYTGNYTQSLSTIQIFADGTKLDLIVSDIMGNPWVPPPSDPYSEGGESDTGGGTGNFDGTSVDIDFASLPTLSAVDTGFISLYNPTLAQLQSLANYMWSDLFDLDTFKKLFGDPMQAILGLL